MAHFKAQKVYCDMLKFQGVWSCFSCKRPNELKYAIFMIFLSVNSSVTQSLAGKVFKNYFSLYAKSF